MADPQNESCSNKDSISPAYGGSVNLHRQTHDEESEQLLLSPSANLSFESAEMELPIPVSSPKAFYCLYASHALARWAWRTWEFSVALILIKLYPQSLLLVSAYGLLDDLVRLLLGSYIGQYINRSDRLAGAISCYGIQNICIATSAAAAALLSYMREGQHHNTLSPPVDHGLLWTAVLAGASSSIGSLGAAVAVEREYPKILCGEDSARLTNVNSVMRAIDLSSQMLAPVVSGFLMTYASMTAAIIFQAVYCLGVWLPECWLLHAAHKYAPVLRQPKAQQQQQQQQKKPHPLSVLFGYTGWCTYFQQSTVLAGVALSLLYFTVLSLGFLMTSYLAWRGMSEATLSLFRAAGALSGLSATLAFQPARRYFGLVTSGTFGITWQLTCLVIGVTPVLVTHLKMDNRMKSSLLNSAAAAPSDLAGDGSAAMLYVLLCGLVASRLGLWLFDLAVTQLQQEQVPDNQLGTVSGVQAALQSFFEILSFVAGCVIHQPERFHWLMLSSCLAVAAAAGLYALFASKQPKHVRMGQLGPGMSSDLVT